MRIILSALIVSFGTAAHASGGWFVRSQESARVQAHRVIIALGPLQTTVWDELSYDGAPDDYLWVFPTKGPVTVGLSSDALFRALDARTAPIAMPGVVCDSGCTAPELPTPTPIDTTPSAQASPGQTVQVSSANPTALATLIHDNGFALSDDDKAVIDAYIGEGYNFLVASVHPADGVQVMRPIRVSTPDQAPVLPLRLARAGARSPLPVTLYVVAAERRQPSATETADASALTYDWDSATSDYDARVSAQLAATGGSHWLLQAAEPLDLVALGAPLGADPSTFGYTDAQAVSYDIDALGAGLNGNVWVTRVYAELSPAGLASDLTLAASDAGAAPRELVTGHASGQPACDCPAPEPDPETDPELGPELGPEPEPEPPVELAPDTDTPDVSDDVVEPDATGPDTAVAEQEPTTVAEASPRTKPDDGCAAGPEALWPLVLFVLRRRW